MTSKRVNDQRQAIISLLEQLVPIAESLDSVLSDERHNKLGIAQRSLDDKGKKGYLQHMRNGGFNAEYTDQNGNRYEFKYFP